MCVWVILLAATDPDLGRRVCGGGGGYNVLPLICHCIVHHHRHLMMRLCHIVFGGAMVFMWGIRCDAWLSPSLPGWVSFFFMWCASCECTDSCVVRWCHTVSDMFPLQVRGQFWTHLYALSCCFFYHACMHACMHTASLHALQRVGREVSSVIC